MKHQILSALALACILSPATGLAAEKSPAKSTLPNILVIYADDLGYGDTHVYNPERGKIPTPNIDKLASEGMRFTDAHSSSGVCSPSRYTLLTGRYHWRSRLQKGIVGLWERPLIPADRLTLAGMLREQGYQTACVGKWHLGRNWPIEPGQKEFLAVNGTNPQISAEQQKVWDDIFAKPIKGGPVDVGFDYYFGTDVPNWPPYVFIENEHTLGIPNAVLSPDQLRNNMASIQGPALKGWDLKKILPALTTHACDYIKTAAKKDKPFFLYMPLTTPHTPLAVNDEWKGKSKLGDYADLVMETDDVVGQVLAAIAATGEADNTLVIFTSDNGTAPYIGVPQLEKNGHYPSGPLRGYKSDVFDGGHRIPFIVRWPGKVAENTVSDQLVHQADLMATFASITKFELPETAGEDSQDISAVLANGKSGGRTVAISQGANGLLSIRQGSWKLIFGKGSGGWSKSIAQQRGQLFNLANDLGETKNVFQANPEKVKELTALMATMVKNGRSTAGKTQNNDLPLQWNRIQPSK